MRTEIPIYIVNIDMTNEIITKYTLNKRYFLMIRVVFSFFGACDL